MFFQKNLIQWFEKNQRPLPWRRHYKPYDVWISEIMLQQTQVETALPYFDRWMKLFPDLKTLAKSDLEKVLKAWEGLGYYSRARNLHTTAKRVMEKHGGVFPEDYEEILSLKGIGRYTAGAIASIAFNQEKPIVDGNVFRVLSRLYAISDPIDSEKTKKKFWILQESLIPKDQARYFNQALMELGALVCTAQNPRCGACPIQGFCEASKQNQAENYPVRAKKKKIVKVLAGALVISHGGKYLIHQRPLGKIMGGLWEFPEWKLAQETALSKRQIMAKLAKLVKKEFKTSFKKIDFLGTIKRNYTHHNETLHIFLAHTTRKIKAAQDKKIWPEAWISKEEFKNYPFSAAHKKIAHLISPPYSRRGGRRRRTGWSKTPPVATGDHLPFPPKADSSRFESAFGRIRLWRKGEEIKQFPLLIQGGVDPPKAGTGRCKKGRKFNSSSCKTQKS
jgi:A/G-specific adenine glycosylase